MSSFSVLLEGPINTELTYHVGLLDNITEGLWELAIASVAFSYFEVTQPYILKIQCNSVLGPFVDSNLQVYTSQRVLQLVIFGGKSVGHKVVIGMKQRDFVTINRPEQVLSVTLKNVETDGFVTGAHVYMTIVFRRIA